MSTPLEQPIASSPPAPTPISTDPALTALRAATADVPVSAADSPYWRSDHALSRFLVARGGSVAEAAKQYRSAMAHRARVGADSLLATYTPPAALRMCFPTGFTGLDRAGFPVLVERIGAIDLVGMQAAVGTEEFLKWVVWYHEGQERAMRAACGPGGDAARNRHKMTCIIDMGGLSMRHLNAGTLGVVQRRARLEEDTYPEVVKRVFLINCPAIFSTVWSVVKVFVDPGTLAKFSLLGSDFLPTLSQFVPPAAIPAYLGGTLLDAHGDANCAAIVAPGGLVPLAYTLGGGGGVAGDGRGAGDELSLPAGAALDTILEVPAGASVAWRWGSESALEFSAVYAPAAERGALGAADGVISVSASRRGVHTLARGYSGPVAHGARAATPPPPPPAGAALTSATARAAPMPRCHPAGGALTTGQAPLRATRHTGSLTIPLSLPAGATHAIVRLRWDNSSSWISSVALARRCDVVLAGEDEGAVPCEEDPAVHKAREREAHGAAFPSREAVDAAMAEEATSAESGR